MDFACFQLFCYKQEERKEAGHRARPPPMTFQTRASVQPPATSRARAAASAAAGGSGWHRRTAHQMVSSSLPAAPAVPPTHVRQRGGTHTHTHLTPDQPPPESGPAAGSGPGVFSPNQHHCRAEHLLGKHSARFHGPCFDTDTSRRRGPLISPQGGPSGHQLIWRDLRRGAGSSARCRFMKHKFMNRSPVIRVSGRQARWRRGPNSAVTTGPLPSGGTGPPPQRTTRHGAAARLWTRGARTHPCATQKA